MTVLLTIVIWVVALALTVFGGRWVTAGLLAHIDAADRKKRAGRDGGAGDEGGLRRAGDAGTGEGAGPDAGAGLGTGADPKVSAGLDASSSGGVSAGRDASSRQDSGADDGVDSARVRAVLRGGMWIGVLERLAVTGCILVGFTPGIAVVVAVKGLGRFPQLRDDPAVSERFVIGSLASLLWAAAVGFAALGLLGLVD